METGQLVECRSCGRRQPIHLAANQVELSQVGMLEVHCFGCGKMARWQMVATRRRDDRRAAERRALERRLQMMPAPLLGKERRAKNRRNGPVRKSERRGPEASAAM